MHMLYHVPDIAPRSASCAGWSAPAACCWPAPTGPATSSRSSELWTAAASDLSGRPVAAPAGDSAFTLDDGDLLRAAFDHVSVQVFDRETVVPEVGPVVAFVDSMRALSAESLPADVSWEAFLDRVRARVAAEVDRHGAWRMTNQVGLFTCR